MVFVIGAVMLHSQRHHQSRQTMTGIDKELFGISSRLELRCREVTARRADLTVYAWSLALIDLVHQSQGYPFSTQQRLILE